MDGLLAHCTDLPLVTVEPDSVLIEQDTDPAALYVLVEGALVIERDGIPFARIDSPGAVFGEMSAVLGGPATATVRAQGRSTLRVADDPIAFLTDNAGAALAVLRTASARLDNLTKYLADVKRQYSDREGHLGMVDEVLNVLVHHQPGPARPGSARDPEPDF